MAEIDKLTMLKAELNMINPPAERAAQLTHLLAAAALLIAQTGIILKDDAGDAQLHVEYAAWLYRRRMLQDGPAMPAFLRMDIHDRLVREKAGTPDA